MSMGTIELASSPVSHKHHSFTYMRGMNKILTDGFRLAKEIPAHKEILLDYGEIYWKEHGGMPDD